MYVVTVTEVVSGVSVRVVETVEVGVGMLRHRQAELTAEETVLAKQAGVGMADGGLEVVEGAAGVGDGVVDGAFVVGAAGVVLSGGALRFFLLGACCWFEAQVKVAVDVVVVETVTVLCVVVVTVCCRVVGSAVATWVSVVAGAVPVAVNVEVCFGGVTVAVFVLNG